MATDNFTGTANPIGGDWTTCVGSSAMRKNGAGGGANADNCAAYYNAVSFANDQFSQIVVLGYGGGAFDSPGVVLRHNGSNFYYVWLNYNGTRVYISHYNGGSWTNIGSYVTISAFTIGHTFRAEIEGDTITVKDNGATIRTQDVSSVGIASGSAGIYQYGNSDYRIDDWEGGDLGAAAITGVCSATLGALTSSSAGVVPIVGSLSKTLNALTCSSGSSSSIAGVLSKTLDALASSSVGIIPIVGAASRTLDAVTVSSEASTALIDALSGTDAGFSGTPDNTDPFTSGQQVSYTVQSPLAVGTYYWRVRAIDPGSSNEFGPWTAAKVFDIINAATGQLAATLGALTSTSAGVAAISGASAQTLADCTVSATATQGNVIYGAVAATLGELSSASAGAAAIQGGLSGSLAPLSSASAGVVAITGVASISLGAITAESAVRVLIAGIFAGTLAALTGSGYGASQLPVPPESRMTYSRAGNRITQSRAERRIR